MEYKPKENAENSWDYEKDELGRNIVVRNELLYGEEFTVDNIPTKGFYVGNSVARWSTSNKLFRVKDPRGFTVEIPTDNLATLLHHCTVVNGVVQNECVWGREGNNHILLPVNSEPYLDTLDKMDTLANKLITMKDIKIGDWVKFFNDDTEYYYLGKIKTTWKLRGYSYEIEWRWGGGDRINERYSEWVEVGDDKLEDCLLYKNKYSSDKTEWSVSSTKKPKIVEVLRNEPLQVTTENLSLYAPQRVRNKSGITYDHWRSIETSLVSFKVKGLM